MNKARFGFLFRIMAVVLFISSVLQPLGGVYANAEGTTYKDGTYELPYSILKDGTSETSVMESYVLKPAKVEVKDGRNYVSFTVKQSAEITGLKLTTADGSLSEGIVIDSDSANNQRTVQFEIGDLTATNDGWVEIEWAAANYFNKYDVDFKFDPSQIPAADPEPQTPAEPVLGDGQYTIGYSVLHATEDKDSSMKNYFGAPAVLTVANGEKSITIDVIKDSSLIQEVYVDGVLATTVSEDTEANTRVISFPVASLSTILTGTVHIVTVADVGGTPATYDMTHTVRYKFDLDSITAVADPAPAEPVLSDGQYTIGYSVLHATEDKDSSMKNYFGTPAGLTVENGQKTLSINVIKDSSVIQDVYVDGVEATTVSEDTAANTRVISFPVASLSTILTGTVHIVTVADVWGTPTTYDMTHAVRYKFDLDSITAESGGEEEPSTGTPPEEGGGSTVTPTPTPAPTEDSSIKSGYYSIDYTILKDGTSEVSMMDSYTVHPGTLIVSGSQKYLAITFTQSKEITGFGIESGSTSVIASDAAANTRTVRIPISGPGARLNAWVKIDWPEFNYYNTYNVDILVGSTVGEKVSNPAGSISTDTDTTDTSATASATPTPSASATPTPTPAPAGNSGTAAGGDIAVTLTDVSGHWAQAAIEKAVQAGLVKGYGDNSFRPNNPISRAEFAVLLSRALKLEGSAAESTGFSDQSSIPAWAKDGVAQIAALQIINGYEDGTFRADRKISRTELAVIMVRAEGLDVDPGAVPTFIDTADIPAWARSYVAAAELAGLVSGKGGNRYAPADSATRAEAVTLLVKLLEQ